MSDWFVQKGSKVYGPFKTRQLKELASTGKLLKSDKIRRNEMDHWVDASSARGLFDDEHEHHSPRAEPAPASTEQSHGLDDLVAASGTVDSGSPGRASHEADYTPRPASHRVSRGRSNHRKEVNGLGVAGLVLGIIAALTCWIPFVGMLTVPFAALGVIFCIIGLITAIAANRSSPGMPIAGLIVCLTAIGVAVMMTGSAAVAIDDSIQEFNDEIARSSGARNTNLSNSDRSEELEYIAKIELRNLKIGDSVLGDRGIFGEVKNLGERTLTEVEIIVYCLDKQGQPVFDDTFHPVLVTKFSFGGDNNPLKPNYSRKFGFRLDDAPSEWSGEVEVKVVNVEFAEE